MQKIQINDALVPFHKVIDGRPDWQGLNRLKAAVKLYLAGKVQRIIVSGGHRDHQDLGQIYVQWLIDHGIPAEHIIRELESYTTQRNVTASSAVIKALEDAGFQIGIIYIISNIPHLLRIAFLIWYHRLKYRAEKRWPWKFRLVPIRPYWSENFLYEMYKFWQNILDPEGQSQKTRKFEEERRKWQV